MVVVDGNKRPSLGKTSKPKSRPILNIKLPRREPSVEIPPKKIVYTTPDKTTCVECPCFPEEDRYVKLKKLNPCLHTPLTLYELAARVVDQLKFPDAFMWNEKQVADWMENEVGLPMYRHCILDNHINGRRLLFLEDPSVLPYMNIHYFDHIKMITAKVRELFGTEFVKFSRSVGLPPLLPLTHCTWFKSRTGVPWGIRTNWTRSDILRWMKILDPKPVKLDHWDLVWYMKPDVPKTLFARIPPRTNREVIPRYVPSLREPCREYLTPRKFYFDPTIQRDKHIWMEHGIGSPQPSEIEWVRKEIEKDNEALKLKYVPTRPRPTRLHPSPPDTTGLRGRTLILARRLRPKPKFLINMFPKEHKHHHHQTRIKEKAQTTKEHRSSSTCFCENAA